MGRLFLWHNIDIAVTQIKTDRSHLLFGNEYYILLRQVPKRVFDFYAFYKLAVIEVLCK